MLSDGIGISRDNLIVYGRYATTHLACADDAASQVAEKRQK